ncbi:MAG: hypothetical protein DMG12_17245 [Acidobacteria bacterium]|nr:MAG: hypothetical protein DMG12_17245 [Acidobacteriota bacterium]
MAWILPALALLTFILSWAGAFPPGVVETWYARGMFPKISGLAGGFADAVSFAWLDAGIFLGLALLVFLARRRRVRLAANIAAGLYLIFFWSWGLNYHRQPLDSKLPFDGERARPDRVKQFAERVAGQINRLYAEKQRQGYDEQKVQKEAVRRVSRVVAVIDGSEWRASSLVKNSWLVNPWFHAAGVDGLFNPFAHEPIVSNTLLDVERPFVIAHELAHVRGYPAEGDANLIAFFATVLSNDPILQYSGWLNLWLYVRSPELDTLLQPGPRGDLQRVFDRIRGERVRWIGNFQTAILDWYLKANSVPEGVRSYSQVVLLAAGTEPFWDRFR